MMKSSFQKSTVAFFVSLTTLSFAVPSLAVNKPSITCYVQINKPSAWANYDVTVRMYNFSDDDLLATYDLPKASAGNKSVLSLKKSFDCTKYDVVFFSASFSPAIWQNQTNQSYHGKLIYNLQTQIMSGATGQTTLIVPINFPDDFLNVPELENKVD